MMGYKMGRANSTQGNMINVYKIVVGKSVGKRSFGNPRHTWEDNIKVDLRERGCGLDSSGTG
jgi:hypothetical protein